MQKKINILMATYNGECYLEEQLESILSQNNNDWQLIISDDGSHDGTLQVINYYENKFKDKIKLIGDNYGHMGVVGNFSRLLSMTDASYICLSDQDDVWEPNKIEVLMSRMSELEQLYGREKPILIYSDLEVVDQNLHIIDPSLWHYIDIDPNNTKFSQLLIQSPGWGATMMLNGALCKLVKRIPDGAYLHDRWIMLVASMFGVIGCVKKPLVKYRLHSSNTSAVGKTNLFNIHQTLYRMKKSLLDKKKYINQAACIVREFEKDNTKSLEIRIAKSLASIDDHSFLHRRYILVKNNILYKNVSKRIFQMIVW